MIMTFGLTLDFLGISSQFPVGVCAGPLLPYDAAIEELLAPTVDVGFVLVVDTVGTVIRAVGVRQGVVDVVTGIWAW